MHRFTSLLIFITIIVGGFLAFTITRYIDLERDLDHTQILLGDCTPPIGINTCSTPTTNYTPIPWAVFGWLVFLAILFVDLVVVDICLLFKHTREFIKVKP
jgi:hypothetical protein